MTACSQETGQVGNADGKRVPIRETTSRAEPIQQ